MKKIVSVLIVLLAIGAAVSAQDVTGLKFTASGAVSASWGIDLDLMTTGFKTAGCDLKITLESAEVNPKKAGEGSYGEVGITGVKIKTEDTSESATQNITMEIGGFYGKIVLGDLTVQLKNGDSGAGFLVSTDMLPNEILNAYKYEIADGQYGATNRTAANGDGKFLANASAVAVNSEANGIGAKYVIKDVMDIALDIGSKDSWVNGANIDNDYSISFGVALTAVKDLSVGVSFNYATWGGELATDAQIQLGAKASYKIVLADNFNITPGVGFIMDNDDDADFQGAIAGALRVEAFKAVLTANTGIGVLNSDEFALTIALDAGAAIAEGFTLQGAVEMDNAGTVGTTDDTLAWTGKVGYAIALSDKAKLEPWALVSGHNKDGLSVYSELYAKAGLNLTGALDNTTFSLEWDSNDLTNHGAPLDGDILGQVFITAKVSF